MPNLAFVGLGLMKKNLWTVGAEGDQIITTFTSYVLHYSDFYLCKFRNRSSHFGPDLFYCKAGLSSKFLEGYPIYATNFYTNVENTFIFCRSPPSFVY